MNPIRWLKESTPYGRIVEDCGPICEWGSDINGGTDTLPVCKQDDSFRIVIRHSRRAIFGFNSSYTVLPIEAAEPLAESLRRISKKYGDDNTRPADEQKV